VSVLPSNSIPVHLFNLFKHFSVRKPSQNSKHNPFPLLFLLSSAPCVRPPQLHSFVRQNLSVVINNRPRNASAAGGVGGNRAIAAACCCCCWSGAAAAACCCCGWIEVEFTNWSSKQIRRNSQSCVSASSPNQFAPKMSSICMRKLVTEELMSACVKVQQRAHCSDAALLSC